LYRKESHPTSNERFVELPKALGSKRNPQEIEATRKGQATMPLSKGTSQKTVSKNIRELHKGPQFKQTQREHGKATANKQAIAIALEQQRKNK
jgi:hypothetical protein